MLVVIFLLMSSIHYGYIVLKSKNQNREQYLFMAFFFGINLNVDNRHLNFSKRVTCLSSVSMSQSTQAYHHLLGSIPFPNIPDSQE